MRGSPRAFLFQLSRLLVWASLAVAYDTAPRDHPAGCLPEPQREAKWVEGQPIQALPALLSASDLKAAKRKVGLTVIVGKLQIIIVGREEVFKGLLSTRVGSQLRDTVLLAAEDLDVMIWEESKRGNKVNLQV